MNKTEANKKIKKLREEINLHNHKYYVENKPVISDFVDGVLSILISNESGSPQFPAISLVLILK